MKKVRILTLITILLAPVAAMAEEPPKRYSQFYKECVELFEPDGIVMTTQDCQSIAEQQFRQNIRKEEHNKHVKILFAGIAFMVIALLALVNWPL